MADIVISGYHGFANSGDEALLFAILSALKNKRPDLDVTVLSKTPQETAREYGVKSISRYNFFKIRKEMKNSKMLLFGGGSLLQDVTSRKSILYYLAIIALAQRCKIKTMLYANGIGPIETKLGRALASRILNRVDVITLRDDHSDEELRCLNVKKPKIVITADPAFTIDVDRSSVGRYYTARSGVPEGCRLCVVSIRNWKAAPKDFCASLARVCDDMVQTHGLYPLFVPMQYPQDLEISQCVMRKMKEPSYVINRMLTVAEMFSVLSEADILIGMRLHSLIYATKLEIPAVALVYDPKISAFMDSLNQPDWVNIESFGFEETKRVLDTLVTQYEQKKALLHQTNKILKETAEENASFAIELLDR